MINNDLIYGIWELHKIETLINGEPTSERANSGMFVFTRDNRLVVVSGANEWVMAYCGPFKIEGRSLIVKAESCIKRELEGTEITREIVSIDEDWLVLGAKNSSRGSDTKISWKRKYGL